MQMQAVEFQVVVKDGIIQIPELYQEELDGESVKVIVMKKVKKTAAVGIIAEFMKNPIQFEGEPFKREELYDRKL
ncbi:MAG: hypothetical protein HC862_22765 [Scytonema sp. RU_4_4]|nr:hypothetical protein [Scytonema sp. RU_4_4]NJR74005.1 hypothetical protein [Scytonema sp. CRU_2_7]